MREISLSALARGSPRRRSEAIFITRLKVALCATKKIAKTAKGEKNENRHREGNNH